MNRRSKHWIAVAASTALATGLLVVTTPMNALASVTCEGKRATIVATPEQTVIVGTDNNDVIVGNAKANIIKGLAAEDVICSGGGNDTVKGGGGNDIVFGGDGSDHLLGGPAHDTLFGEAGADTLDGGRGWFDFLNGGSGDDAMDGGSGAYNTVDYRTAPGAVAVDLSAGTGTGDGSDTIANVGNVWESSYDDHLVGSDTPDGNMMDGGPGDDLIDGNGGDGDTAMTCDATGPVTIDLINQTSTGEGNDALVNMVNAYGGIYGDTLLGNDAGQALFASCFFFQYDHPVPSEDSADVIHAGGGDDFFAGLGGDNVYDGGPGNDFGAWGEAHGPVTINLTTGTAVTDNLDGAASTDTITAVENAFGSYGYDDVIHGNAGPNWMFGLGGDDRISGGAGDDWLGGQHFYDLNDRQTDTLNGQHGYDHCTGGEVLSNCESTDPIFHQPRLTTMEKLSLDPAKVARMGIQSPSAVLARALRDGSAAPVAAKLAGTRVRVVEFGYKPKAIAVPVGTKVTWKSVTTVEHDVTLVDGSWQSPLLEEGDKASHVFETVGTYKYTCSIHVFMKAKVIVE